MMGICDLFKDELERYQNSVLTIRQYLVSYESQCLKLIGEIKESSFEDAQQLFDRLYEIQGELAVAKYKYEFSLTERLDIFVYHFDRDDIYSREFWYKQIKEGLQWPEE